MICIPTAARMAVRCSYSAIHGTIHRAIRVSTLVTGRPLFPPLISFGSGDAPSDYHHNTNDRYHYLSSFFLSYSIPSLQENWRFTCYTQDTQHVTQHDTRTAA